MKTNLQQIIALLDEGRLTQAYCKALDMRKELRERIQEYESVMKQTKIQRTLAVYRTRIIDVKEVLGE